MPNRVIREGILTSEAINNLTPGAELFYRRLMNKADDFGRYDGRPAILLGELYALKLEKGEVSIDDVKGWIAECEAEGVVTTYDSGGKRCIVIHKFDQRVRAAASKWPQPPSDDSTSRTIAANVGLDEDEDEGADEGADEDERGRADAISSGSSPSLSRVRARMAFYEAVEPLFGRHGRTRHPKDSAQWTADQTCAMHWFDDFFPEAGESPVPRSSLDRLIATVNQAKAKTRPMAWLTDKIRRMGGPA